METCPICGEQFDSPLKLSNHLKKSDEKHQFLKYAIKKFKKKSSDYQEVYDNYITFFNDFTTLQEAEDRVESYLNQKKEEEKQRKEQLKREKQERLEAERELKRQERERLKQEKQARLEAEREEKRRLKVERELEKQKQKALEYQRIIEERQFKNKMEKDFIMKLESEYKPLNLAKYFYSFWDVNEFNIIIATACIKSLYFKYQLSPEEVKFLLRYTAETGHSKISDAKFLIEESQRFYQYAMEINSHSIPHLVKAFYDKLGLSLDKRKFVNLVDRIKTYMKDNELEYDDAKRVMGIMLKKNITSLYFFPDYIYDAIKNKPHYDIPTIISEIVQLKKKVSDYPQNVINKIYNDIKSIILSGAFNDSYNYSEFMFKINLIPDEELKSFALNNDQNRNSKILSLENQYKDTLFEANVKVIMESYSIWCSKFM